MKDKWNELIGKYQGDNHASLYFDNVNAELSGTVYNLAQMREDRRVDFAALDEEKTRRLKDLDDLANLSKNVQSIGARVIGLSMGGGLTFLQFAKQTLGAREIVYVIIGGVVFYLLSDALLRLYQMIKAPRILREMQKERKSKIKEYEDKSKQFLGDLLTSVNRISKNLYDIEIKKSTLEDITNSSSSIMNLNYTEPEDQSE